MQTLQARVQIVDRVVAVCAPGQVHRVSDIRRRLGTNRVGPLREGLVDRVRVAGDRRPRLGAGVVCPADSQRRRAGPGAQRRGLEVGRDAIGSGRRGGEQVGGGDGGVLGGDGQTGGANYDGTAGGDRSRSCGN